MAEIETTEVPVEATPEVSTPELPELRHEYQPMDDLGRPMGGKQVLKYRTQDELVSKMQEQNILLMRKLRSETRKNRLRAYDEETFEDGTQRYQTPIEFKQVELTPDQRVKLSRDLLDPEAFDEAADVLFEYAVGAKPADLRKALKQQQDEIVTIKAKQEADAFVRDNPDYYKCPENFETITGWMVKNDLAPVRENFQRAYDKLRRDGVIVEGPSTHATPAPLGGPVAGPEVVPTSEPPEPEPEPVKVPVKRIPTGLTRDMGSDAGTPIRVGDDITYEVIMPGRANKVLRGVAAIDAMPSDEYRRRLKQDPTFEKKVEKLEATRTIKYR